MNKKKKVRVLVIQLIVLVLAILAAVVWLATEKEEKIIYDFARTIQYNEKSNYQVTGDDIVESSIMAADMKPEYVTNKDEVLGKYLTGDAFKGSHVLNKQLSTDPPYIDKSVADSEANLRKITLKINYATSFAGDIKAGDIVDLMFQDKNSGKVTEDTEKVTSQPQGSIKYASSKIFLQGISVYQVFTGDAAVYVKRETDPMTLGTFRGEMAEAGSPGGEEQNQNYAAPAYVTLAVSPQQYEEISSRLAMGEVSLVGRFGGSQDAETKGYLIAKGDTASIYAGQGTLEKDIALFDSTQVVEAVSELPNLYEFILNLSKIQMQDVQKQKYTSIYTRYSAYMNAISGPDWVKNNPQGITMDDIAGSIAEDEASQNAFMSFKTDLDVLAKELKGNQAILPW